jgi:hypothetical protein
MLGAMRSKLVKVNSSKQNISPENKISLNLSIADLDLINLINNSRGYFIYKEINRGL